jgi:hypothetical protein
MAKKKSTLVVANPRELLEDPAKLDEFYRAIFDGADPENDPSSIETAPSGGEDATAATDRGAVVLAGRCYPPAQARAPVGSRFGLPNTFKVRPAPPLDPTVTTPRRASARGV